MTAEPELDLERFVSAQEPVFPTALAELQAGRKRSHWMWFVFPQLRGLGHSSMAQFYGIASLDEARRYLRHPTLGVRLPRCTEAVMSHRGVSLHAIFGSPDDMKFRSSMTLFAVASEDRDSVFGRAVAQCCDGRMDERTLALLGRSEADRT